jgi:hypothetical protein
MASAVQQRMIAGNDALPLSEVATRICNASASATSFNLSKSLCSGT